MIERLKDAAALAQMGPGEKLLGALQVAALGMGVTFVVLLALMGCIRLCSRLAADRRGAAPAPAAPGGPPDERDEGLDEEAVAVLCSAIAMMRGGQRFSDCEHRPGPRARALGGPGPRRRVCCPPAPALNTNKKRCETT